MKMLYLVRHAKSDWSNLFLRDFDRPLNARGENSAPLIGDYLAKKGIKPDLILSSPALRAKTTAITLAEKLSYPIDTITYIPSLYESDIDTILALIRTASEEIETLIIVGHNPELTECANFITHGEIDNIPTCGVVEMRLYENSWDRIGSNSAELVSFVTPKKII